MLPAEVRSLATAANKGDQGAALELRLWCEENPGLAARVGEAVAQTTDELCAELAGADRLGNLEAIKAYAHELHRQLVGRDSSALADLAARRVVANWLHLALLENRSTPAPSMPIKNALTSVRLRCRFDESTTCSGG